MIADELMTIDAEWFGYNLQYPLIDLIRAAEKDHHYVNWENPLIDKSTCSCGRLHCAIFGALSAIERELEGENSR